MGGVAFRPGTGASLQGGALYEALGRPDLAGKRQALLVARVTCAAVAGAVATVALGAMLLESVLESLNHAIVCGPSVDDAYCDSSSEGLGWPAPALGAAVALGMLAVVLPTEPVTRAQLAELVSEHNRRLAAGASGLVVAPRAWLMPGGAAVGLRGTF